MYKIMKSVSESNIDESVNKMLAKCYENGAGDNVSVVIVKCIG